MVCFDEGVRGLATVPKLSRLSPHLYSSECVEKLFEKSYARAKRLTIRRIIAA